MLSKHWCVRWGVLCVAILMGCGDDGSGEPPDSGSSDPATEAAFEGAKQEFVRSTELFCACPAAHDDTEEQCLETRTVSDMEWDCIRRRFREEGMDTEATYLCMRDVTTAEADCIEALDCSGPADVQSCTDAWETDMRECFDDPLAGLQILEDCI